MTVAESLRDKLRYNLMMNHDSIEMSDKIFGFATPAQKEFNAVFREKAFELAVKHNLEPYEVANIVIEKFRLVANDKEEKEYRFGV